MMEVQQHRCQSKPTNQLYVRQDLFFESSFFCSYFNFIFSFKYKQTNVNRALDHWIDYCSTFRAAKLRWMKELIAR